MDFNFDTGTIFDGLQTLDVTVLPPLGGQAGVLTVLGNGAITLPGGSTAQQPSPAAAGMLRYNDGGYLEFYDGVTLSWNTLSYAAGTVSSVSFNEVSDTAIFTTSPTTGATGAVAVTMSLNSQSANVVFAGPDGTAGQPTFRSLVAADVPPVTNIAGGTSWQVPYQSATNTTLFTGPGTAGQALVSNGTSAPTFQNVVNSFSAGTTGLTPNTSTTGAVTLAGTLSLGSGGTNSSNSGSNGSIMYNDGTAIVNSTVGLNNQALLSTGAGAPTWLTVSSTVTTNQIVQGDGAGAFTANGATFTGSVSFSGVTLNGTVTNATDAVTKAYADGLTNGLSWKQAVRAATTVAGTLATDFAAGQVIDGYTLVLGDRILIKNQASATENGIYIVTAGTPTRSTDADTTAELNGAAVYAETGTINANTAWTQTTLDPVIGTNNIVWAQFSGQGTYTAGSGLTLTGGQFNVRTDSSTTYIDGGNNVAVLSSTTLDQVLLSQGTGNTALWGSLPLGNSNAVTGTLAVANGGTGDTSFAQYGVIFGNNTSALGVTAAGTSGQVLTANTGAAPTWGTPSISLAADAGTGTVSLGGTVTIDGTTNRISTVVSGSTFTVDISGSYVGQSSITTLGAVTTGTWNATPVGPVYGGTGLSSYTTGDTLYASAANTLSALPIGTSGQVLTVVAGIPGWTTLSTEAVTTFSAGTTGFTPNTPTAGAVTLAGTLNTANGGTGLDTSTATNGQLLIGNGAGLSLSTLTAGTGISIGNGAGSITVSNTGVTSVALSDGSTSPIYTISGSPVTTTGTLTFTLASQSANTAFLAPNGSAGQPGFRAIAYADLPLQLYVENPSTPTVPVASGTNAVAIGSGSTASATGSFAEGDGSNARIFGQKAYANGSFASAGDAQHGVYVLRNVTSGTTFVELFLDGTAGTQRIVLPNNSLFTFDILIAGVRNDGISSQGAGYRFVGLAKKDGAGTISFVGTPSKTILGETVAAWDARLTADTVNDSLKVETRGAASTPINWVATVLTTEVTF